MAVITQPTEVLCRNCQQPEGYVRGLTIGTDDQKILTYICESCRHSWRSDPQPGESLAVVASEEDQTEKSIQRVAK